MARLVVQPGGGSSGPVTANNITDATTTGKLVITAPDAAAGRDALGAGTSSLTLGTTSTTAKAGDYAPAVATSTVTGTVRLTGDLGGTAVSPTVPALTGKAARALTQRAVTASYTLVLADGTDVVLHCTSATAVTITLPTDANVAIPQEQSIPWRQYGAGQITFAPASGVTLVSRGSAFKSAGQYAEGVATKVAANVWLLTGDIAQ